MDSLEKRVSELEASVAHLSSKNSAKEPQKSDIVVTEDGYINVQATLKVFPYSICTREYPILSDKHLGTNYPGVTLFRHPQPNETEIHSLVASEYFKKLKVPDTLQRDIDEWAKRYRTDRLFQLEIQINILHGVMAELHQMATKESDLGRKRVILYEQIGYREKFRRLNSELVRLEIILNQQPNVNHFLF
jgi:hypothetical protein